MSKKQQKYQTLDLTLEYAEYKFTPQPDITTHELALCIQIILDLMNLHRRGENIDSKLEHVGVTRHFTKIDKSVLLVKGARVGGV